VLAAIIAALAGFVRNLSVGFALHVLFEHVREVTQGSLHVDAPISGGLDHGALLLASVALLAIFRLKLSMVRTLATCSCSA
jgi:chromate transporter